VQYLIELGLHDRAGSKGGKIIRSEGGAPAAVHTQAGKRRCKLGHAQTLRAAFGVRIRIKAENKFVSKS
jgi:hypothetical protein